MKIIDDFLNNITMYRLALYVLIGDLVVAIVLSFFELLPFDPINLIVSVAILITVCWLSNKFFSKVFNVSTNVESSYITAFILTLIITPPNNFHNFLALGFVGVLSQVSKYVLVINKKHIFNPAALAALFAAVVLKSPASWWVGNLYMFPAVILGGILILRKIKRFKMATLCILTVSLIPLGIYYFLLFTHSPTDPEFLSQYLKSLPDSSIFFFSFIMLTEPLTSPVFSYLQLVYAFLVGSFIYIYGVVAPSIIYYPFELALLSGNIFSYFVSPKNKLILKLKEKIQTGPDMFDFIFEGKLNYIPGQYMEWTLNHKNPDTRGLKRYFTLASSPTESTIRMGTRFYPNGSSFKKALSAMQVGSEIIASQLGGEFIMPKGQSKKLVFMAGGIGITPFRSMIKFLIDSNQKRDIVLLYSVKSAQEIIYKDIFDIAKNKLGIKIIYVATDTTGFIDEKMIKKEVPDFKDRYFYISGPHSMVDAFEKTLASLGVSKSQIKTDYFPGYV